MNFEIEQEVKVLDIDTDQLKKDLQKAHAKLRRNTKMRVISFDFKDDNLELTNLPEKVRKVLLTAHKYYIKHGSLKQNNAHLRIRYASDSNKVELCFKVNEPNETNGSSKIAREYNALLSLEEAEKLEEGAKKMGLSRLLSTKKDDKAIPYRIIAFVI